MEDLEALFIPTLDLFVVLPQLLIICSATQVKYF